MGLWTDYTKKDTPEDNDTLMLYDAAGKANKQTLFSGFWKWVAKKLKEATLSDLETTNKTMIGAINELNSKSQTLDFVYCRTKTKVGMMDIDENNLVNGTVPSSVNYIPVIIGHSKSNRSQDNIFFDNLKWHITSDTEQEINIRFYKCAK